MSVRDAGGTILAAVGFRYAKEEPLFLENYTGAPIEQVLRTPRERIAEIGNLASAGGGRRSSCSQRWPRISISRASTMRP